MDQGLHDRHGNETNGTSSDNEGNWLRNLESIYLSIGPVFSWTVIAVGALGITGNILTLLVYSRLGFVATINISYTALAVSDLLCVLTSMVFGFRHAGIPLPGLSARVSEEVLKLVGAYPHFAFSRTTGLLTAWISLERCICVVFPTRVKVMISRTVTQVAITACFVLGCFPLVFVYAVYKIERRLNPDTNSTSLALLSIGGPVQEKLEGTTLFLFAVVYPLVSYVSVTACTVSLVIKLQKSTKWRRTNATAAARGESSYQIAPARDLRVTRVVVVVAVVFLACSLPTAAQLVTVATVDGYTTIGHLRFLRLINGMVTLLFAEVNSSLNIVIFTVSGQRFRSVLLQIIANWVYRR
ncbi:chemosensory receptor A [Elysia marginata]|uniref:Chemosensory receptor A n=1 Tax=Elysia marginata TaxID=1093978 RepID=A0AAV4ELZ0_9GAST|nr:chemosensory receptor A [Elysia marginata]